ncbi:uncharacterized protein LOC141596106 isoform X2 [Silene latifolia]|uniref:uncharacterized protein LOC141596106 isoform X2 n=1 Tax=Silene latifolia TaxID=37657 RepID=UPI003D76D1B0
MNNQFDVQKSGGSFTNMASLAPLPLQPPRVLDQKVANFTQEQQQQHQEQQKQQQQQQQQQNNNQEPLRCPRCDSSNTKFCYYNNYSLSQPRHFCKACKRYWTRGGTLRSVPVGGGCRKNKRVKRPSNNSNNTSSMITTNNNTNYSNNLHDGSVNSLPSTNNNINSHIIHDLINTSTSNPLFYGINHGSNHNLMNNFPFLRYDLHNPSQINGVGLGFSSGLVHNDNINGDFRNGLSLNPHNNHNNKHIFQDLISSNPNTSSISSLLASSFQMKSGGNNFETILPSYEGSLQMKGGMYMKEVKMELEGQNRAMDHHWSAPSQNLMDQNNVGSSPSSDPSNVWGNGPNLGNTWLDPSHNNLGSSFSSLI